MEIMFTPHPKLPGKPLLVTPTPHPHPATLPPPHFTLWQKNFQFVNFWIFNYSQLSRHSIIFFALLICSFLWFHVIMIVVRSSYTYNGTTNWLHDCLVNNNFFYFSDWDCLSTVLFCLSKMKNITPNAKIYNLQGVLIKCSNKNVRSYCSSEHFIYLLLFLGSKFYANESYSLY